MIYAVADIHGDYEKYICLLRKIDLRSKDTLYILGDVLDRGSQGINILRDMMARPNVVPILGNHEFMAAYCLKFLMKEITDESIATLGGEVLQGIQNWFDNGGMSTLREFRGLSKRERQDVLDYLGEFTLYEEVSAGGKDYLLVHAGLGGFSPDKPLDDYEPYEMLFCRPDYSLAYYPDKFVITGHTPTRNIPENPCPDRIYQANRHIAIDCGCGYGGPLAAICLDTGEEFYEF